MFVVILQNLPDDAKLPYSNFKYLQMLKKKYIMYFHEKNEPK